MKKLFLLAFAAFAFAACTDDNDDPMPTICPPPTGEVEVCPDRHIETLSFESSEGMKDIEGMAVLLGDVTVSGGSVAGVHHNVFWAKSITNFESYLENKTYDGYLCSSANENVWIGTRFSASEYGDYWGGFVITANAEQTTAKSFNQFTVWAPAAGVNGSATCLIGYDDAFTFEFGSGVYARPTIEFAKQPRTVCHCYLANAAVTYTYVPTQVAADKYYYRVVVVGSLEGGETGRVTCTLIDGLNRAADWTKVDLTPLGRVDKLTFVAESNEANAYGLLVPTYFAIDELGLVADK